MNQISQDKNIEYKPAEPGRFVIDAIVSLEGRCTINVDKDNLNGWHQSRLTNYVCQELCKMSLNRTTPDFIKPKIKVFEDQVDPPANSLPGQLIIKALITPDGACYMETGERNLDGWHFTKVAHFLTQKLNEFAFDTMTFGIKK